ncbi:MAG: formimidoylglutamate deiminase [Steroidobacteraceae bacterium]
MTTIFASQVLTRAGWMSSVRMQLRDGRIASLEPDAAAQPGDERHAAIVPAMPNLHSHAFQRGMAGLAETRGATQDDFWSWRDTMYRFAARMRPEQLEAVAGQAYMEMLESGFGRVGEFHYLHRDVDGGIYADIGEMSGRIAAAAQRAGIALTLLPVFYAHSSFGAQPPREQQRRFVSGVDDYARLIGRCRALLAPMPGARLGVAPHSLRAVTPEELAGVLQIARDLGAQTPVHIHIAEQVGEVRDCEAWCGARPVRWLLDHAPVDGRWCLVHATHVDEGEIAGMAAAAAVVGLCPVTEANLGDGIFPLPPLLERGGAWGIGSDSNVQIGAAAELALLEYSQRLSRRVRNVAARDGFSTGRTLFQRALLGGSRALAAGEPGLSAGAAADMVSLAAGSPALACRSSDALLDSWIFAAPAGSVDCVWVAGRKLVEGGRHLQREAIQRQYLQALQELCA